MADSTATTTVKTATMRNTEISRWVQMMGASIKRSISKSVLDRAASGLCLHCDEEAKKRGLCSRHYEQYRRAMQSCSAKERPDWEVEQIREGRVLNVHQIMEIRSKNIFTKAS